MIRLTGFCPMGCGRTLQAEEMQRDNKVICMGKDCPDPNAAQKILSDPETEHIVHFDEDGFAVRHPLRERIGDALLTCSVHQRCVNAAGLLGYYRATGHDGRWTFEEIE